MDGRAVLRQHCGMQVMPLRESRERAEKAHVLRAVGFSWNEIATHLGYRSHGAAQTAVKRHRQRNPLPDAEETLTNVMALRTKRTIDGESLLEAAKASGDLSGWAGIHRALTAQDIDTLKLHGLHAPERHLVAVAPVDAITRLRGELLDVLDAEVDEE